jgi:hypothetical protein
MMFAGLLLLTFLCITYIAVQFIQDMKPTERFSNPKRKFTLAAECNCLPGYIPSKLANCTAGQEYICRRLCDSGDPNCDPVGDVRACY